MSLKIVNEEAIHMLCQPMATVKRIHGTEKPVEVLKQINYLPADSATGGRWSRGEDA